MGEKNKGPNSNLVLVMLFLGWIVSYIDRTAMNLAISQIGIDLSLDPAQQGVILSSFFMGYALMQIPGGWLADRFGSRRVIVIALLFWSVFTGLTGLASTVAVMIMCRFLFGIGEGGYPAASTKAIADYFAREKRSNAQSIMMSSNAVGLVVAPLIVAPLLVLVGWRHVFWMISLLGLIVIFFFLKATKKSIASNSDGNSVPAAAVRPKGAYKELLKNSMLWKAVLVFFCANTANWGLISWMPTYLMATQGIDLKSVGLLTAVPSACMAICMVTSGRIITKIGGKSKYGVIAGMIGMAGFLYLLANAASVTQVIIYQSCVMVLAAFVITYIFTLPHRIMRSEVVGTAFGIVNTGGQVAGIFSPMIIGALVASSGGSYSIAFFVLAATCFVGALIAMTLSVGNEAPKQA